MQCTTFRLGTALFAVNIFLVDEINRHLTLVPVAGAPDFVRGITNLRGQIVTVVDLAVKMGMAPRPITRESRCVILKRSEALHSARERGWVDDDTTTDTVGLLVDRIEDMVTIDPAELGSVPANVAEVDGRFIAGVVRLKDDLMIVLRLSEVLAYAAA